MVTGRFVCTARSRRDDRQGREALGGRSERQSWTCRVNGAQFGTRDEAVATSQKLAPPGAAAALSPEPRRCVIFKACCGARRARGTEKLIPSQTVCMTGPLEEEELS